MSEYYEIDFLGVESAKSGDAITLRYKANGRETIHVVDGGYLDTGTKIVEHLNQFYGSVVIDHVVLTHPDQDHANGLRTVVETCEVRNLWINRPWEYADQLLPRFANYNSVEALKRKLRDVYSATAELETIALERGISINSPLQGAAIGEFTVLAPSLNRYLDLVAESGRTPEIVEDHGAGSIFERVALAAKAVTNYIRSVWGHETFPPTGTSNENEMSVVQTALLKGERILLTGDAGRETLKEAADYAEATGINLPGIDLFQVPHHGGRHNVSTEILDRLLGKRLSQQPEKTTFSAICSAAKADEDHPRKAVVRAMLHRGAHFSCTNGQVVRKANGIDRPGWRAIPQVAYPEDQEE